MKKLILIAFLSFSLFSYSQYKEFGDITVEMLEAKQSPIDSTAHAEVLNEKGIITFSITNTGIQYILETVRRVKIFDKDGYDEANIELSYYVGSNSSGENVKDIDAKTYYLEDGKVKDEKVRNKEIFEIEENEYIETKKFTMPKIQDGVIIEYSYKKYSPNIRTLPKWYFQSTIPTRSSEFQVIVPQEFITYRSQVRGYQQVKTDVIEGNGVIAGLPNARFTLKNYTHKAENLEGIDGENYVNNIRNYITSVSYELSSVSNGTVGDREYLANTWNDVVDNLRDTESYSKELERTRYFEEELVAYLSDASTDLEKLNATFNFVKSKVNWNKKARLYCSDDLDEVYENGEGNSADINIMLTAMLKHQGFDANPIVSSTIANGIPYFPTVTGLNYVMVGVTLGQNFFILDATDKYSSPNLLPARTLNWEGIEIFKEGNRKIDLSPKAKSKVNYSVMAKIGDMGAVSGQCRVYYFDQFALNARNAFTDSTEEEILEEYQEDYELGKVENFSQSNLEALDKPLVQSFAFSETEGLVEKIGDKIYLSPLLFLKSENNPFKSTTRNYPIDFTYPKSYKYRLIIDLPEGYQVEYKPENTIYKMAGDLLTFTYVMNSGDGKLILDVSKEISVPKVGPELYKDLRDFYISMIEKQNEKVVLAKS